MPSVTRPVSDYETPAWGRRTPENQKACLRILRDLGRERDTRCYIQFSLRSARPDSSGRYPKAAWPMVFPNRDAAQTFMDIMPVFKNGQRFVSCSIEPLRKRVRHR